MSRGTDKTPPQIRVRYNKTGKENLKLASDQLLKQGMKVRDVTTFVTVANSHASSESGQIAPLVKAAEAVGAEIHWH